MGLQAGNGVPDVVDGEHDPVEAQRVRRCDPRCRTACRRPVVLRQLEPALAVGGPHHRDLRSHVVETHDTFRPTSLDRLPALQTHAELDEERDRRLEVVDHDCDVVHTLDRHAPSVEATWLGRSRLRTTETGGTRTRGAGPPSSETSAHGSGPSARECGTISTCARKYVEISAADRVGGGTCPPARGDSTDVGGVGRGVMV